MIYFLRRADGAIKIGYSSDVLKRMASLEVENGSLELLSLAEGSRHEEKPFKLTHLNIPESPDLWTTTTISRRLSFAAKTLAKSLNMPLDVFLWYVLNKLSEEMRLIEQLMTSKGVSP